MVGGVGRETLNQNTAALLNLKQLIDCGTAPGHLVYYIAIFPIIPELSCD